MNSKKCSKCGNEYPLTSDYFFMDKSRKNGFRSACKKCDCGTEFFSKKQTFDYFWEDIYKKHGVYEIRNCKSNKSYVGSAKDIFTRWCAHMSMLRNNNHENVYLQNAYNKHGEDAFKFIVLEFIPDKKMLVKREQHWINNLGVCDKTKGYNLNPTAGNALGRKTSEETKDKLKRINNIEIVQLAPNGSFVSEWLSAHEVQRQIGYKACNINRCLNGHIQSYKGYVWVRKSDYYSGTFVHNTVKLNKRPVYQCDLNGNVIRRWESSQKARKETGIWNIHSVCCGIQNTAGGFKWRFVEGEELIASD